MKCTVCGAATQIIDTQKFDTLVWRRRRCIKCSHRMNTHETPVETKQNSRVTRHVLSDLPPPPPAKLKKPLIAPSKQPAAVMKSTRQLLEELRELQTFRDDDWPD